LIGILVPRREQADDVVDQKSALSKEFLDARYEWEKRKYHPTASRMTSGSNCRHLNKPQTRRGQEEHPTSLSRATCKVATLPFSRNSLASAASFPSARFFSVMSRERPKVSMMFHGIRAALFGRCNSER
jgi:hypothetical protein